MPKSLSRRSLWALVLAALAICIVVVAVPYVASTRIVRDRIADEISDWSGLRVTIGGDPQISVWPHFQAVLSDVSMAKPDGLAGRPVIEAERMEIDLSAIAALGGNVEFETVRLMRPTLRVATSAAGMPELALPHTGRLGQAIALAGGIVNKDRVSPDTARLPQDRFGVVAFSDGRILTGAGDAETELATDLTGTIDWERLDGKAKLTATGVWRGEAFSAGIDAAMPLLALGGGETPLAVTFKAAPTNFSFDGKAALSDNAYFEGKASFSTTSLRRMMEWTEADILHGAEIGAVSIKSRVTGTAQRIRFEEAEIRLDGNPASGAIDLLLNGSTPVVAGTLAFDTLDLGSFLSAFTPLEPAAGSGPGMVDRDFANRLNLDLRLSASKATAGTLTLAEVAATARVNDGFAAFDISDATAFGGTIQTGLRFDRKPGGAEIELRLLASDIDGGAFGAAAGISRLAPAARGTISVILKGRGTTWDTLMAHSDGSISASFGKGALSGFDADRFVQLLGEGKTFPLADVSKGSFAIDAMEIKASVTDGVATLETATARSASRQVALSGTVPYRGGSLALSGTVGPAKPAAEGDAAAKDVLPFVVGGSWSQPYIAPNVEGLAVE